MRCPCGQENPLSANQCSRCGRALLLGFDPLRLVLDIAPALGLVMALGLVLMVAGRPVSSSQSGGASQDDGRSVQVAEDAPQTATRLRIAVTVPKYDDMGKLLDSLGSGYRHTTIEYDDLLDAARLAQFDVVFVTCGEVPRRWVGNRLGRAGRLGASYNAVLPQTARRLQESIRQYLAGGGTLYASDWMFDLLAVVFPELVDSTKMQRGAAQTVQAEVLDLGLQRSLGSTSIELHFDKPAWRPAAFTGPQVTPLLAGTYKQSDGRTASGPLLVQFPWKDGNVIFTSFHNEKQNSEIETQLLRYLVFATITAQTSREVNRTMVRGGFSPVYRSLLAASPQNQAVRGSYHNPQRGPLRFVLGFQHRGARLQLGVRGPQGQYQERAGKATFAIEIPEAARGIWQYTITPQKVPYENFPFTLTVGQKR